MIHSLRTICLAIVFAAVARAGLAAGPRTVPVDGAPFSATLVAVDARWQITLGTDGKRRTLAAADLVAWGRCVEPRRAPILVTADGGLVMADSLRANKDSLTADSPLLGRFRLPLDALAGVVVELPAAGRPRDRLFDRIARATGRSDRILLLNGDTLTGTILGLRNRKIRLQSEVGEVEIATDRVAGFVFNPARRRRSTEKGLRVWVGLSDGSRLLARRLVTRGKSAKITTAAGLGWQTSLDAIVYLMPLGGRVTYLSDLEAARYRHEPYLSLHWPYRRDRNVTGGRLRADGQLYLKGLGMHSAARLTYDLDQPYRRFEAALAIDDSTAGSGSVRARVLVDGEDRYTSETIRGGQAPVSVSVDLDRAKRLELVVDFADRADQLDRADWLNARLVK